MSTGNGHRWSKFWWQDWDRDIGLRTCSLAAQGLWMRMLCIANEATPRGHVIVVLGRPPSDRDFSAWTGTPVREIKKLLVELEEAGVFSRTPNGVIYNRRMVREETVEASAREAWRAHGKNGGNPNIIRGTVPKEERPRPYRRSDSPQKTERIFQRDGGLCHWCQAPLVRDNPSHPQFFHVDHIIAVRDGGGVEEANLVAACHRCNMLRARHSDSNHAEVPTATQEAVRQQGSDDSDSNPQKLEAEEEARSRPPRSPPASRGGRAARPHRNGFVELERRLKAAENAATIDGTSSEIVDFLEFTGARPKASGGTNG